MRSLCQLVASLLYFCMCTVVTTCERTVLSDLREFGERGSYGRFAVPIDQLSKNFQQRKAKDSVCGNDVQLALPQLGSTVEEGTNSTTEIDIIFFEADDFTLRSELSCEMRENVAVERNGIAVQIPYVSGSEHGAVLDVAFVEGNEKYFSPYSTNMGIVKGVDIIEETEGGVVTLYKGHDVLVFEIQKDAECLQKEEQVLAQHMQEVIGKTFHATSYPLPFDFWGCSSLGWNVSFCQVLKEKECEIQRFGGDVCTITKFTKAHFCPANFTLVNATGFFREELPFFTTFPLESLESATYSNEHSNGIVYPCLSW